MDMDEIDRLARRRANAKMGWFVHAGVYLVVNLMLAALAIYPALGWGVGLALHGATVWLLPAGGSLLESMAKREREKLAAASKGDPW